MKVSEQNAVIECHVTKVVFNGKNIT